MRLSDPYNVSEFKGRATTITIMFAVLMSLILFRLWHLQIWDGERYRGFSDRNRFKRVRMSAPRGKVVDRNGVLIADSNPRFDVRFTRANSQNFKKELEHLMKVFEWSDEKFESKLSKVKSAYKYKAQLIQKDISYEQLMYLEGHALDLLGVDVEVRVVRDYLFGESFFHIVGYTGELNEEKLRTIRKEHPDRNYRLGDQIGVVGLEALFEDVLRGQDGQEVVVVDVKGRRVSQDQWKMLPRVNQREPEAGSTIRLTLDSELQAVAHKELGDRSGSAVALDPFTGEVLAYVSRPAINPNALAHVISKDEFNRLISELDNPFLDRVVGEHYPPGSTFKVLVALAALDAGAIDTKRKFHCPGYYVLGRRAFKCHKHSGHGWVNLVEAIERSCDVYFYNLAAQLGLDFMGEWSQKFGLGSRTFLGTERFGEDKYKNYRFNYEQPGFIPFESWVAERKNTSVRGETINSGIGQGAYTVTALQLARLMSIIGNKGSVLRPQMVLDIRSSEGKLVNVFERRLERDLNLKPEALEVVLKGMERVVYGKEGTARASRIKGIRYGGKTGTAQVVALSKNKDDKYGHRDHSLFVALAPLEEPKIALAVIVEHGGHGSSAAAPIAKKMIEAYLKKIGEL